MGGTAQVKSLELVIVQFEEVKRLIVIDRVPQLRLAHILLDSAVELIMHRMAESELNLERYPFEQLEFRARRPDENLTDVGHVGVLLTLVRVCGPPHC